VKREKRVKRNLLLERPGLKRTFSETNRLFHTLWNASKWG
jgi:hypothetical protein